MMENGYCGWFLMLSWKNLDVYVCHERWYRRLGTFKSSLKLSSRIIPYALNLCNRHMTCIIRINKNRSENCTLWYTNFGPQAWWSKTSKIFYRQKYPTAYLASCDITVLLSPHQWGTVQVWWHITSQCLQVQNKKGCTKTTTHTPCYCMSYNKTREGCLCSDIQHGKLQPWCKNAWFTVPFPYTDIG